ncbi:hypothetical protein RO3G_09151 [Rhizopus delemar RA 99-880]|uniref:Uncharacterized protein n=1 Tax=Rhizopus delemar (strain RA 99-880 / ATCC MYA-4621 / FGSC 9543 / NRRL 43880) TaxID=246409 RepID=I1C7L1_RHIO9|nr:hypothetical protein RO3G_09151 [Rhizopus delemar RA 99-880]|eukprot:EIE84441.1 hypothetical protein RO3G_09151 [Rhizopus delemar RA 99-880]
MMISENVLSNAVTAVFIFWLTPLSSTQLDSFGQYVKACSFNDKVVKSIELVS